jgi:adenine phosphoribosyltransferase
MDVVEIVQAKIRSIPDYPKAGIIFKDITPVLGDAEAFEATIDALASGLDKLDIDYIAGIESRGFIFGAPLARKLDCGFIPIRKAGKLPWKTLKATYELEYGTAEIEIHSDCAEPGSRVVLVDDLLATGGTSAAAAGLLEQVGAKVVAIRFLMELAFLNGRSNLDNWQVDSLIVES